MALWGGEPFSTGTLLQCWIEYQPVARFCLPPGKASTCCRSLSLTFDSLLEWFFRLVGSWLISRCTLTRRCSSGESVMRLLSRAAAMLMDAFKTRTAPREEVVAGCICLCDSHHAIGCRLSGWISGQRPLGDAVTGQLWVTASPPRVNASPDN